MTEGRDHSGHVADWYGVLGGKADTQRPLILHCIELP